MSNAIVSAVKAKVLEQAKQMAINAVPTLFAPDPPPANLIQAKPPLPMFQVPGMMNPAGAALANSISKVGSNNTGDSRQSQGGASGGGGSASGKGSGSGTRKSGKQGDPAPPDKGGKPPSDESKADKGSRDGGNRDSKAEGAKDLSQNEGVDAAGKVAGGSDKGIEKSQPKLAEVAENQKGLEKAKADAAADVAANQDAVKSAQDSLASKEELAKQAELDRRAAAYPVETSSEMGDAIKKTEGAMDAERGVARAQDQLSQASKQLAASEDALRSASSASDAAGASAKTLQYADDLKGVGKKVLGPVGTAIDVYQLNGAADRAYDLCRSGQTDAGGRALLEQAGDTVGGTVGAGMGAAGGAVAGAGVGSVPAAIGGGIAGGYAGSKVGKGGAGLLSDNVPFANEVACDVAVRWHDTKEFAVETGKAAADAASNALDAVTEWVSGS